MPGSIDTVLSSYSSVLTAHCGDGLRYQKQSTRGIIQVHKLSQLHDWSSPLNPSRPSPQPTLSSSPSSLASFRAAKGVP